MVAFPVAKAFITPLSNLEEILCSFSDDIHVITGNIGDITTKSNQMGIHTYGIYHKKATSVLTRIARYTYQQVRISLIIAKLSKNVDLIIFFMEGGALLPMLTAKLLRKKIMWALPSCIVKMVDSHKDILSKVAVYLQTISYALPNRIILYSENLINEWNLEKYKNKISIAHRHFLDFDKYKIKKKLDDRDNLVGYIGRLSEEKGVLNFVKAVPEILEGICEIRFLIGGDGQLREEIEKNISKENLNDKVKLVGWISHDELPNYLNELKLIVLPSYTEGLPNIMLEAMACGTPVLATPVGAIPDIIKDGETGFVMENNLPECIAENVERVLNYPCLNEIMKNARELVEKEFTYEAAVESYKKVLEEL